MKSNVTGGRASAAIAIVLCLAALCGPARAAVTWTGAGGTSWATSSSWNPAGGPNTTDTAIFNDTGASPLPGDPTSILNANRTIGSLSFSNTSTKFHTLDLATRTLTITGNLNFNLDQGQNSTTTVRNGSLVVSGPFANINVGRAVSGSATVTADLTGLTSLTAGLQELNVGVSTAGNATGTLRLGPSNSITAQRIFVGASFGAGEAHGTLRLGANTTLLADEFHIGVDDSVGLVDVVNAATVNIGSAAQRTLLEIANQDTNTLATYSGVLDLKNAAVNLHLDSVLVGQKNGGPGGAVGQLLGGGSGTVAIGDVAARGNVVVANNVNGGSVQGTVDFSRLATLTAYVNDFQVGRSSSGNATGSVLLPATSTVDAANGILVGVGGGGSSGSLALGKTANTLLTNQLVIGQDYASGVVTLPAGASLNLGSAAQRTALTIGSGTTNTGELYSGRLDLAGGTVNAFLGNVTVGQKDLGPGTLTGTWIGGNAGSVQVGAVGSNANFYVGRTLAGGGNATGTVDLGGMTSLTAYLNTLSVGTANTGSATGTLTLPATNTINAAAAIIVGANASGTLNLGTTNTITTNQLTIGQDYGNGLVTIPAGGTLNLGSPTQRTNVTIASATTNTNETYTGKLDLTAARLVAYLGNVVVGNKNAQPGNEQGTFIVSARPDNLIDLNSLTLGGNQSTGTFIFGGGTMYAGSIAKGTGTANFNWAAGQLSVTTFGTPTTPFNLANTNTGTLAPGTAANPVGTTTVYGNYTQGAAASTAIDIAGVSTGAGNDQLVVSGSATLAGSLSLKLLNGFTPSLGQSFLIATYASRTGTFGFVAPPHLPQDVAFQLDYTTIPAQLNVRMVAPTATNWLPATSTGTWATPANWDTNTTPGTTSTVTVANTTAAARTLTVSNSTTVHRISLQGTSAPITLDVPQGVQLGVANQLVVGQSATLTGAGQILGDVVVTSPGAPVASGAVLAPGTATGGALGVSGDLTQTPSGTFKVTLSGPAASGAYSRAAVTGAATLAGTLQVTTAGAFVPVPLESYPILTYATHAGHFTNYQGLDVPGPLALAPVYTSADLRLIAVLPGDADTDGQVNFADLVALAQNYNRDVTDVDGWWRLGDFTYDGTVDFNDLVKLAQNYNTSIAPSPIPGASADFNTDLAKAFASVPEPGAITAFAACGVALLLRRRCRYAPRGQEPSPPARKASLAAGS